MLRSLLAVLIILFIIFIVSIAFDLEGPFLVAGVSMFIVFVIGLISVLLLVFIDEEDNNSE